MTIFIFLGYLIINVLSTEILRKDGSVKTSDGYIIFDSSEFLIGKTIHFEIKSKSDCDNYLYYKHYDNIDNIDFSYSNFYQLYSVKSDYQSTFSVNGVIQSITRHFEIKKKEEELGDLNGNYLYLHFDCVGSVEISNSKSSKNTIIIVVVIIVIIVLAVFIIVIVCFCIRRRTRINNIYNIQQGYPPQVNPYYPQQPIYPPYGMPPIVYQVPNAINNNPINANNGVPNNVPIIQNEPNSMNEAIPHSSINGGVNYFVKPKI